MKRQITCALLMLVATGCPPLVAMYDQPRVQHVVVCWLKEPGNEQARQALISESYAFVGQIPGLTSVSCGTTLPSTSRPSVDSSFDVAIVMTFRDAEALSVYQSHPKHVEAVERTLKPLVARVVIYDFAEFQKAERGHRR